VNLQRRFVAWHTRAASFHPEPHLPRVLHELTLAGCAEFFHESLKTREPIIWGIVVNLHIRRLSHTADRRRAGQHVAWLA
jgi:hypothetical protein